MEDNNQKEVHVFGQAIEKYIGLLNSQMEAYPIIMNTLVARLKACAERMKKFTDTNKIRQTENGNEITFYIPMGVAKQFVKYNKDIEQSYLAIRLIPQNVVVAFVSIYDAFIADIINGIYSLRPELLNTCEKEYSFVDIIKFDSIEEIKQHIIEKEVESVLRESHKKQFDWLSKKINLKLTEDLSNYGAFIEITERRNLFVHANGKVSRQYLSEVPCDNKVDDNGKEIVLGDVLTATPEYVRHCYNILFEIGVKLGQVIWRKLDEKRSLEEADGLLMDIIYDLLKNHKYELSIIMSEFATRPYVKDFNKTHEFVKCINKALGYYLSGNKEECKSIIAKIDWSASSLRYKLACAVLNEDYNEACEIIKEIGNNQDMQQNYREWPLFTDLREKECFKNTYKEIYKTDFNYIETKPLKWEDIIKESIEINRMKEEVSDNGNREPSTASDCTSYNNQ